MAKGEIVLNELLCKGCSYCVDNCPKKCLAMAGKLSSKGVLVPSAVALEQCNGCGICGWMCPDFAIEVYKYVEA